MQPGAQDSSVFIAQKTVTEMSNYLSLLLDVIELFNSNDF